MRRSKKTTHLVFAFGCVFFFVSTRLNAGSVLATNKSRLMVKIDEGVGAGISKGTKICFSNTSGKKVGCGVVTKTTQTYSLVKFKSEKTFAKIKKGFSTSVEAGGHNDGEDLTASDATDYRTNIKLGYIYSPFTPARYNKVTYLAPQSSKETGLDSLWKIEQSGGSSLAGFYLETEFGVGQSMSFAIGGRYRFLTSFEAVSDYNKEKAMLAKYVSIQQSGSALGFYGDFGFLNWAMSSSAVMKMSMGLDFDMSKVLLKATQKNDDSAEENEVANYSSSLNLASVRLGTGFLFGLGSLGLIIPGVNVVVPVASLGGSTSATVSDSQASMLAGGKEAGPKDLISKVAHEKSSFAIEVLISALVAF